jgi:SAM-dependent methyltransferase
MLDLGCSLGQLTRELSALSGRLTAVDLSPVAVAKVRDRFRGEIGASADFIAARSTAIPLRSGSVDLVIAADGLYSWDIEREERALALREIHRTLSSGGHAILTEHMRRTRFSEFISEIDASPLQVVRVIYFHDRLMYQLESWFKAVPGWRTGKALRGSIRLAEALSSVGRLFGTRGARHVFVVARKD